MSWILILLAPVLGGVIYGIERKVKARMQRRMGPPILQPFYDMFKLMDKRTTIIHETHIMLGLAHFFALWLSLAGLLLGWHLLYVIFLHLFSTVMLVLAGFSVRSVYSHIGANRELMTLLAYEPILILVAIGFYLQNGTFEAAAVMHSPAQITLLPLLFVSLLFVVLIKLKKSPFDAAEAHQEIVGGVEIEYSGLFYEFLYMAKLLEYCFVYALIMLFGGSDLWIGAALALGTFLVVNMIDNATARIRMGHLLRIFYLLPVSLGLINILWIVL